MKSDIHPYILVYLLLAIADAYHFVKNKNVLNYLEHTLSHYYEMAM